VCIGMPLVIGGLGLEVTLNPERTRDVVLIFERPAGERPSGPVFLASIRAV